MAAGSPRDTLSVDAETRVACEHADRCAGCPLIESAYGEQLQIKGRRVAAAFSFFGDAPSAAPVAPAAEITGYRSRAKLMVSENGAIGLFAKGGGHTVVDIPRCRVLAPSLLDAADALREMIAVDHAAGWLRAVDLREVRSSAGATVLATLVVDRALAPSLDDLRAIASRLRRKQPIFAGIAANFRNADAPQILGDETTLLDGATEIADAHGRSTHLATFGAFVQAHRGQASRVHDEVIRALDLESSPKRVVDLYGGGGAIALAMAAKGAEVELVESFAPAALRARQAATTQGVSLRATTADVGRALRVFVREKKRFDGIIVNPPRRGLSPEVREHVAKLGAERFAYVSCDPETLARDLDHLARLGWKTERLQPIDMIPLTEEVETVATLHRGDPPPVRTLYADDAVLAIVKEGHEPMPALEARVRAGNDANAAVSVFTLEPPTSGVVLFVRELAARERWNDALRSEAAVVTFLAICRGITREKGLVSRGPKKRPSTTRYRRLAIVGGHSLVRVTANHLGMRDSADAVIAKHLAEIGHPLVGDTAFGDARTNRFFVEKHALDRPFLHLVRIECDFPNENTRLMIEAPLAGDLRMTLGRLATNVEIARLDERNVLGRAKATRSPAVARPEE